MSYYIKGDKTRGREVIKVLEDAGGVNSKNLSGKSDDIDYYYFIDKHGDINYCSNKSYSTCILKAFCEELTLPEKWNPKFKEGDKVYSLIHKCNGVVEKVDTYDKTYKVSFNKSVTYWVNETNLQEVKWTPQRGEKVLVRNCDNWAWEEAVFSFKHIYSNGKIEYHTLGGNNWEYCIPFDLNKLGKITED